MLHHLIPVSVTSRMWGFECPIFTQWLSESCPRGLSERLKDSCGASWNQMCRLLHFLWMLFSEILHRTSLGGSQLQECSSGKAQVALCHGSSVTGEKGDSSEEEEADSQAVGIPETCEILLHTFGVWGVSAFAESYQRLLLTQALQWRDGFYLLGQGRSDAINALFLH